MIQRHFILVGVIGSVLCQAPRAPACVDGAKDDELQVWEAIQERAEGQDACWVEFVERTDRRYRTLAADAHWPGRTGEFCDITLPYAKLVNSHFVIDYGLANSFVTDYSRAAQQEIVDDFAPDPGTQRHSWWDYIQLVAATPNAFHQITSKYTAANLPDPYDGQSDWTDVDGFLGIGESHYRRIKLGCAVFEANPVNLTGGAPIYRAAVSLHESWHMWQHDPDRDIFQGGPCGPDVIQNPESYGLTNPMSNCRCVTSGGHQCGKPLGACPTSDSCDDYIPHGWTAYPYGPESGVADLALPMSGTFQAHTPNQIMYEFACDIATHPSREMPLTTQLEAESYAAWVKSRRLRNGPAKNCLAQPWLFEELPPAGATCEDPSLQCSTDADCISGTEFCAVPCCMGVPR